MFVNDNNTLTQAGIKANKRAYNSMTEMGMTVRCHTVSSNKDKKVYNYFGEVIKDKSTGLYVKFQSYFTSLRNCVHVFTGKLHGGFIGIDIDVKGKSKMYSLLHYFEKLMDAGELQETLTCRTPSGGYHFVYKLTEHQLNLIGDRTFGSQLELFDCDIDVLYNAGRFAMCGAYDTNGVQKQYKITDWSKPAFLSKVVFNEIVKKIGPNEAKTKTNPEVKRILCIFKKWNQEELHVTELDNVLNEIYDLLKQNALTMSEKNLIIEEYKELPKLSNKQVHIQKMEELFQEAKSKTDATPIASISDKPSNKDELLKQYLNCLNQERCNKYDTWLKIGAIIFNEQGSFILFNKWSKLCPEKYSLEGCQKTWKSFMKNSSKKITIKSLMKWAKEDNPEKFAEIEPPKEICINIVINDILEHGISDTKAARLYSLLCSHKYLWDEINEHWYFINKFNIWKKDKKGSKVMYDMGKSLLQALLNRFVEASNDKSIKGPQKEALLENYAKAVKFLESYQHKKQALEELKGFCLTEAIFEKLDNVNPYLFAFDNGVYDLKENKFRLPKPEELISCTCRYDYQDVDGEIEKVMTDILNVVDSMFSCKKDPEVILTEIAQCLDAVPALEEFYTWRGKGRNGKGVLRDLIAQTFGSYFDPIDIEYFNQTKHGKSANAADEIMARKKNCRIVITTEPESDMKLKFNLIKMITGRDDIQCRHNYSSCFNFKAKFRLFFQTNFDLEIDNVPGQAKVQRIKIRYFPYVFLQNPTMEDHKQIDNTLKERILDPKYKIAFFHILLGYYNKWIQNGRKIEYSKNFIEQTNEYLAENDPFTPFYEKFVNDRIIEQTKNNSDCIKMTELFKLYKRFYVGENKSMTNKEFKSALENKGFKVVLLHGYPTIRCIKFNQPKLKEFINNPDNIDFVEV
jgi:phage/plasmid-associated DNA primase